MGKFCRAVDIVSKANNPNPVSIGEVTGLNPLSISYNGITISKANGDNVYVNSFLADMTTGGKKPSAYDFTMENKATQITCSNGTITENHTTIINDTIYPFLRAIQEYYIINIGDFVAVQMLGNNTYIVLEKVQKQ